VDITAIHTEKYNITLPSRFFKVEDDGKYHGRGLNDNYNT